MAKEHGTSKSQAVRNYLKTHRKATNKEVSEALGKQGVEVTPTTSPPSRPRPKPGTRPPGPWCRGADWASPRSRRHWHC